MALVLKDVFDAHPGVDVIYVVDNMPFLNLGDAENHKAATGKDIEKCHRKGAGKASTPDGGAEQEADPIVNAKKGK